MPPSATRAYLKEPDYDRPLLELSSEQKAAILEKLTLLYGKKRAEACLPEVERLLRVHYAHKPSDMVHEDREFDARNRFSEQDIILITYGDLVHHPDKSPLFALSDFLETFLRGSINTIHILPFFPYSSDRGFAVVDFEQVDPRLGTWEDIDQLANRYRLMFDSVINHVSAESRWFREFRNGNPQYQDFFITFSTKEAISDEHLQLIMRPRASDLLTPYKTIHGEKYVLEAVVDEGIARAINRRTICQLCLFQRCSDPDGAAYKVAARFGKLIEQRIQTPAFHPNGDQRVIWDNNAVFSVIRQAPDGSQLVLALTNVTPRSQRYSISVDELKSGTQVWRDLLSGETVRASGKQISVQLKLYQLRWLTPVA